MVDRTMVGFEMVPRRELVVMGRAVIMSPASLRAAATAATLAPELVILLRRVTRWALRAPERAEWAWVWEFWREWEGNRVLARGFVELDSD